MTTAPSSYNPRMASGLRPGKIEGRVRVPGSKSIAQRAIVCAGLAEGSTEITGLPDGTDVRAALALVGADAGDRASIVGRPPARWTSDGPVTVGESGTLARFATAVFSLCGRRDRWQEIRGEGSLLARKSPALFAALREAGADLDGDGWPVRVRSAGRAPRLRIRDPSSSQEVSALWIALAGWPGPSTLEIEGAVPSRSYLELTRNVLASFGARVEGSTVHGPLKAPAAPFVVEPDASSAAVFLAAGHLSGGRVEIEGLGADSAQPDARFAEILARFGGDVQVDLADAPDLAPVIAAVAAAAALKSGSVSRLTGLGTLPGKESSRIEVLARGLAACGFTARAGADDLEIGPGPGLRGEVVLDPAGDHRMAFAFALLGLVVDGVRVADPGCVAKSWPGFWDDLAKCGAKVLR
jgi:3-phosphoshikimate 1-carboxyvinyltransferase